jgi:catechol 2,3-dioxygenase-like lactoylglutathione lyase family enzyme
MAAQKRFFVDTLGGKAATIGTNNTEVIEFPNVFLFFRPMQKPTGGTIGSTVNHVGFSVPDLKPVVTKLKANGYKMITSESVASTVKITDDIAAASPTTNIAFTLGPEDIKVELVEVKTQTAPIQLHHVHFFGEHREEMQDWYAKVFGATKNPANPNQAFVTDQLNDADGRHARPSARSHRLRGQGPRAIHQETRGRRHSANSRLSQSGRARHQYRLHQGSLGHQHRAD